ncbi:GNAT family N-acetyltransferase [Thalassobaculum fulvum]|nr:GNAT family N-acetyltransferase [Thalassobaculum fulvum]
MDQRGTVTIRHGLRQDVARVYDVYADAIEMIRESGVPIRRRPRHDIDRLCELSLGADFLRIAEGEGGGGVVGFSVSTRREGWLHLEEIGVLRAWQRRGIGSALLRVLIKDCLDIDCVGITLTTDRLLPFNAPLYRQFGFREPGREAPRHLRDLLRHERALGLDPHRRVGMLLRKSEVAPEALSAWSPVVAAPNGERRTKSG